MLAFGRESFKVLMAVATQSGFKEAMAMLTPSAAASFAAAALMPAELPIIRRLWLRMEGIVS